MERFEQLFKEFKILHIAESINYDLMNEILISHHSTAIEGSTLTEEETRVLIVDGLTTKGKPLSDHNMVKDHQDALVWIVKQAKEKVPITAKFIQDISALVMKNTGSVINSMAGSYDSSKGDWRKSSVSVGTRYFTNYQKVEREVTRLVEQIQDKLTKVDTTKEKYDLAFDAHFYLVSIHPFADGNGRTSRLLMNYILAYFNLPLAIIFTEDKADYYQALEKCRKETGLELQPIRDFMYLQQIKYLEREIAKYKDNNRDILMSL